MSVISGPKIIGVLAVLKTAVTRLTDQPALHYVHEMGSVSQFHVDHLCSPTHVINVFSYHDIMQLVYPPTVFLCANLPIHVLVTAVTTLFPLAHSILSLLLCF